MAKLKRIWELYVKFAKFLNARIHWVMKVWMCFLAPVLPMLTAPAESVTSALGRLLFYYLMLTVAVFLGLTVTVWLEVRNPKEGGHG